MQPSASAVQACENGYRVAATGLVLNSAQQVVAHITSKKYVATFGPVDEATMSWLRRAEEGEHAQRMVARKRKLETFVDKRRGEDEVLLSQMPPGVLYQQVDANNFLCGACGKRLQAAGFLGHVASQRHGEMVRHMGMQEDHRFLKEVEEVCVNANLEAQGCRYCEICSKNIAGAHWEMHVKGRPHQQKARQLGIDIYDYGGGGGGGYPSRHAPPTERGPATGPPPRPAALGGPSVAELPLARPVEEAGVAESGVADLSTLKTDVHGIGLDTGPTLLARIPQGANVPVFAVGEDIWAPTFEYVTREPGFAGGVEVVMGLRDSSRWGTVSHNAVLPMACPSPGGTSYGARYVVERAVFEDLVERHRKMHLNARVVHFTSATPDAPGGYAVVFLEDRKHRPIANVVELVAEARGPKGPNYLLLCLLLNEYFIAGWDEPSLKSLADMVQNRIWKSSGGLVGSTAASKPQAMGESSL